ncbi:hypothetical protein DLM_1482 [Aquitalea magnusonii]|uniref:Uncharacterized protein n=1 Tax=Aquitalea magnusonii TaxID=332411 RepID=A0A3G9GFS5_9NEIS|nr:hypothetical protein DLM_1482 [Aquitalea magnusonii]
MVALFSSPRVTGHAIQRQQQGMIVRFWLTALMLFVLLAI